MGLFTVVIMHSIIGFSKIRLLHPPPHCRNPLHRIPGRSIIYNFNGDGYFVKADSLKWSYVDSVPRPPACRYILPVLSTIRTSMHKRHDLVSGVRNMAPLFVNAMRPKLSRRPNPLGVSPISLPVRLPVLRKPFFFTSYFSSVPFLLLSCARGSRGSEQKKNQNEKPTTSQDQWNHLVNFLKSKFPGV